jgi:hypothetical protein
MEFSRTSILLCAIVLLSASASAQVAPSNPFLGQLERGLNNGTGVSQQFRVHYNAAAAAAALSLKPPERDDAPPSTAPAAALASS